MTVDLLDRDAPDSEDFVVCWLQPLLRAAVERRTDDPFPFAIVGLISATDDPDSGVDDEIVQIDFLDRARDGLPAKSAAKQTAKLGHRRMTRYMRYIDPVLMSDGSTVYADYVDTVMKPVPMPYDNDQVRRYVARYRIGLHYTDA
jgi:hypothetical protein